MTTSVILRRRLLAGALAAPAIAAPVVATLAGQRAAAQTLPATPACGDNRPTRAQTEGPYFTARSPERASLLEPGFGGARLVLVGFVLTTGCRPVANALLDFWQADAQGAYDNRGYRMRGRQYADAQGRYRLETVLPGEYPGRTPHIHVKVQPPGGRILTTQLYFPDQPRNARDGIFRPELMMTLADAAGGKNGRFDFVLA